MAIRKPAVRKDSDGSDVECAVAECNGCNTRGRCPDPQAIQRSKRRLETSCSACARNWNPAGHLDDINIRARPCAWCNEEKNQKDESRRSLAQMSSRLLGRTSCALSTYILLRSHHSNSSTQRLIRRRVS